MRLQENLSTIFTQEKFTEESNTSPKPNVLILRERSSASNIATRVQSVPLPTTSEWDITVCSVSSTNQVYLWLGEAATELRKLHEEMLSHHLKYRDDIGYCISSPGVGHVYGALVKGDKVRRVQVINVDMVTTTCMCLMIDYGKEITLNWNKLVKLDIKFHELPGQAVKVILAGVQHDEGRDLVEFVNNLLEGRRLVGFRVDKDIEGIPSLVLFDTSQEEDIMVSAEIIKHMNNPTQSSPLHDISTPIPSQQQLVYQIDHA